MKTRKVYQPCPHCGQETYIGGHDTDDMFDDDKPCGECGGSGEISTPEYPDGNIEHRHICRVIDCLTCKGTGIVPRYIVPDCVAHLLTNKIPSIKVSGTIHILKSVQGDFLSTNPVEELNKRTLCKLTRLTDGDWEVEVNE